ncbi:MEKHLA domain-containing protein [Acidisoma cellulosilytica]|uniref:MEKHLA domain-containing protein n=1 Tax=Acidisoma cellulosilyticum TaxID=2802395 RepID=A0A963Z1M5_9PROT|nr:MEKHLA domain-containing protein [Acidisoma cellulosilyticum]MCB8881158.1 MEKHLA domain-containing protein [Acidisoma cellulosilyticum]
MAESDDHMNKLSETAGEVPPLAFSALLLASFHRLLGRSLVSEDLSVIAAAHWLYADAPFCVLAHNTAPDPCFIYANKAAQACFEYGWDKFTTLPSRLSAEAPDRAERQSLLDRVTRDGFATGYAGTRISGSGRRFRIEEGIVWQIKDDEGHLRGQGAMFPHWQDLPPDKAE